MNDTEQLFLVVIVWALIAAAIARFIPSWLGRIAFCTVAVGVPFWEFPYGYYKFQVLCRENTRPEIFERIPAQEEVCADYPYVTLHKDLLGFGFTSVETRGRTGEVKRYTAAPDGHTAKSVQQKIRSTYCLTFVNNNRLPWRLWRHDVLIKRTDNNRVVARQSRFNWAGMWWQEKARPILGNGGTCSSDTNQLIQALRRGAV
ncbi:MAG TPA: hypothetical protein VKS43_06785 [Burkholderiales bacterium]|nr:hypothetical protein [Burkholderiales bacterium]